MTEKGDMNLQEQEIDRLRGNLKMAGGFCHEMKQPLMVISGQLELLLLRDQANPQLIEKINKINFQLNRLSELTTKLMKAIQG